MQYLLAYIIPLLDWHVLFAKLLSWAVEGMTAAQILGSRRLVCPVQKAERKNAGIQAGKDKNVQVN